MAAMLEDITKEADEKYFVNVLQHGGNDVTTEDFTNLVFSIVSF
jgi:HD superfamily phosphohydrolase YqeK